MNVLIIEDEKAAARNLSSLLTEIDDHMTIVSVIDSVVDSVEWFATGHEPDLVFMDIHLADGSAFDIFDRCVIDCPIVFTTAYDEYALKAFKVNSIDYLLKPISSVDLRQAVDKFSKLQKQQTGSVDDHRLSDLIRSINRTQAHTTHLLIPKGGSRLVPLSVSDVAYFYIEDGLVKAQTMDHQSHLIPYTLDQLSEMVDPSHFFRANRQYLISKESVADVELWFGSRLSLKLKQASETKIIINKPRVGEFKMWFSGMIIE